MTTFIITTEDEKAGLLRNLLSGSPLIKSISEEKSSMQSDYAVEATTNKIKQLLLDAKAKNLFEHINDASEWQREIRTHFEL